MSKNVVVCCDGTGNEYGPNNSNVVKLYSTLAIDDRQVALYDPGVGTFSAPEALTAIGKWTTRVMGLAFARGLSHNLGEAYRFLMEMAEPDDRIYIFGFSRGAYTARALAGMLHKCGLLHRGQESFVPYLLNLYAKEFTPRVHVGAKRTFARPCSVEFLGLWDTVSTIGWVYEPVTLPHTRNNPDVRVVRHAIAIDERRCYFRQNRWADAENRPIDQDVREVWFPGVHCDVGGSYPDAESGLSQIALDWMLGEAIAHGLRCRRDALERVVPAAASNDRVPPSAVGPMHKSLSGWWRVPEALPRRYKKRTADGRWRTRWRVPLGRPRFIADGSVVHQSVLDRRDALGYAPENLPATLGPVEPWRGWRDVMPT